MLIMRTFLGVILGLTTTTLVVACKDDKAKLNFDRCLASAASCTALGCLQEATDECTAATKDDPESKSPGRCG
jgi:hypothetical protein